jgi:hypothetical protein
MALICVIGFVQGYLTVPAVLAVPRLAEATMRVRPWTTKVTAFRVVTLIVVFSGILLLFAGLAMTWANWLSIRLEERPADLGRYWGLSLFVGMLVYAVLPSFAARIRPNESK